MNCVISFEGVFVRSGPNAPNVLSLCQTQRLRVQVPFVRDTFSASSDPDDKWRFLPLLNKKDGVLACVLAAVFIKSRCCASHTREHLLSNSIIRSGLISGL